MLFWDIFDETEKLLIDNPYSLYFIFMIKNSGFDFELPRFIERKREVKILLKHGLIKFLTGKHTHYKPTDLTDKGKAVYKTLDKNNIFNTFNGIPLNSEYAFKEHYYSKLKLIEEQSQYSDSIIYPVLLKNIIEINKWIKFKDIELKITNLILLEIQESLEIWEIHYELGCIFCRNSHKQKLKIKYDVSQFKYQPIKIKCEYCGASYMLCPLLNCLYSL